MCVYTCTCIVLCKDPGVVEYHGHQFFRGEKHLTVEGDMVEIDAKVATIYIHVHIYRYVGVHYTQLNLNRAHLSC